mmetsp:Transcript_31596/g.75747  ORF Transcript_31596/g.75747 Transcript_31596/m.75747 type:complete len:495 (-) Transcript_31596:8-1492(-)
MLRCAARLTRPCYRPLCARQAVRTSSQFATKSSQHHRIARRLAEYTGTLNDPDEVMIKHSEARRKYWLDDEDLAKLEVAERKDAFTNRDPQHMYWLPDVVELALRKRSKEDLTQSYESYLRERVEQDAASAIFGVDVAVRRWYMSASTDTVAGRRSVQQGLISNSIICTMKFGVWTVTQSSAILADFFHSLADVCNYGYRLLELKRSSKVGDSSHPYGYAPLRYITADRSFMILGACGGVIPIVLGLKSIVAMEALAPLEGSFQVNVGLPITMLATSALLEAFAAKTAWEEIKDLAERERMKPLEYLHQGRDVLSVATYLESMSGVMGAGIGSAGILASYMYGNACGDVMASTVMGGVVAYCSAWLLKRTTASLLGRPLPLAEVRNIILKVEDLETVIALSDVKTEMIGTDAVRFKAEVRFNAEAITKKCWGSDLIHYSKGASLVADDLHRDWIMRNNAIFLENLTKELKVLEAIIAADLKQNFVHVHIDLEPW